MRHVSAYAIFLMILVEQNIKLPPIFTTWFLLHTVNNALPCPPYHNATCLSGAPPTCYAEKNFCFCKCSATRDKAFQKMRMQAPDWPADEQLYIMMKFPIFCGLLLIGIIATTSEASACIKQCPWPSKYACFQYVTGTCTCNCVMDELSCKSIRNSRCPSTYRLWCTPSHQGCFCNCLLKERPYTKG
ncbi:uncharacterized protein [Dermacentor albipictus]|uniref:uncharacterized protein isoform X2 n=1 Tax=Dermacentor albipictus TaxID=60249 RepID=UPI0031FC60B9